MYCPFWSVRFRNIKHTHITVQPSPPYVWLMKLSPIKQLPPLSFRSWWPLGFLPPWLWPNLPECIHLSHEFSVFMRLIGNLTQGEASSLCPFFPCPFPVTCSGGLSVLWHDGYLPLQHWLRFQSTHLLHFVHSFVYPWVTSTFGPLWTTLLWMQRCLKSCFPFYRVCNRKWGCCILRDQMIIRFLRIGPSAFFSVFFFSFSSLFWDRSFYRPDRLRTCYSTKNDLEIILLPSPSAGWDCVPPCLGYALLGIEPSAPYQLSYLSWPEYAMQFSAM